MIGNAINMQRQAIYLPQIGVRRHRLFLTDRPNVVQLRRQHTYLEIEVDLSPDVGPSVTPDLDSPSTGGWALASFVFLVMLVSGCVAMVQR